MIELWSCHLLILAPAFTSCVILSECLSVTSVYSGKFEILHRVITEKHKTLSNVSHVVRVQ